jgi:uncharacterized protein (AIM24 family)
MQTSEFPIGSRIVLKDLSSPEFNGKFGFINSKLEDGRHQVLLESGAKCNIRPSNMKYESRSISTLSTVEMKYILRTKGVSELNGHGISELREILQNKVSSEEEIAELLYAHQDEDNAVETMIITVGCSPSNIKNVMLPFPRMKVRSTPLNHMQPHWKDKFHTEVSGSTLIVTRTDANTGWRSNLKLAAEYTRKDVPGYFYSDACYSSGTRTIPMSSENQFHFSSEINSNIVEIQLMPDQVLRAAKGSFIYLQNGEGAVTIDDYCPKVSRQRGLKQIFGPKHGVTRADCYSYTGPSSTTGLIGLGASPQSTILLYPLSELGHKIYCKSGSFLASSWNVTIEDMSSILPNFNTFAGSGDLFIQAPSPVIKKTLKAGERLTIRATSIIALTQHNDIEVDHLRIIPAGGKKVMGVMNQLKDVLREEMEQSNGDKNKQQNQNDSDHNWNNRNMITHLTGPGTVWLNAGTCTS